MKILFLVTALAGILGAMESRVQATDRRLAYGGSLGAYVPDDNSTPAPAPAPPSTSSPAAAEFSKENEHAVNREYDTAWTALPETTRSQLHDDEVTFRNTLKTFDPPTRIRTLKERIEYLKSLTPGSTVADPGTNVPEQLRMYCQEYDKIWQETWEALPDTARLRLRDEEARFRDTLKNLDPQTVLQKLEDRVAFFKSLTVAPTPANGSQEVPSDADMKQQLVGIWKAYDETIALKSDGTRITSGTDSSGKFSIQEKWDVRDGNYIEIRTPPEGDRSYTIISLTKDQFELQDNAHGRHTGTWTRQ
jgi:hypothetical protein